MGMYKDLNDYEIMYLVEDNDDVANNLLFEKYRPIILSIAIKYKEEAKKYGLELDDLIQEGYVGLYNATKSYNPNKDSLFYTYALISIRSKILNLIRCNNNCKNIALNNSLSLYEKSVNFNDISLLDVLSDNNSINPSDMVIEKELSFMISSFLYSLSFDYALVFELRLNGFSNKDISLLLDVSNRNVTNSIFRINKKLKNYLNKNYHVTSY